MTIIHISGHKISLYFLECISRKNKILSTKSLLWKIGINANKENVVINRKFICGVFKRDVILINRYWQRDRDRSKQCGQVFDEIQRRNLKHHQTW